MNITKDYMREQLASFDTGNSINTTTITSNLRTDDYTAPFQTIETKLQAMSKDEDVYVKNSAGDLLATQVDPASHRADFYADVDSAIAATKAATTSVRTAIDDTKTISSAFEAKITAVINTTANITNTVIDQMWELGSCTILAESYAGVYDPSCSIAYDFAGTFVAAYCAIMFGIVMLPFICCSSKRYYQYRDEGDFDKQEDLLKAKAGGHNAVVPVAAASSAQDANGAVAVATAVPVATAVAVPVAVATAVPSAPPPAESMYPDVRK